MDCSLPGSSVHGIFQARVLEWGAIAFSEIFTDTCYYQSLTKSFLEDIKHHFKELNEKTVGSVYIMEIPFCVLEKSMLIYCDRK